MKKIVLKLTGMILCFAMLCALFVSCGTAPTKPAEDGTETAGEAKTEQKTTEEEPIKQVKVLNELKIDWLDDTTFTVGKNMKLNEFGQIAQVSTYYETTDFEYGADHLITKVTVTDNDDKSVGYESFSYDGTVPTGYEYDPNDGFRSSRNTVVTTTSDGDGKIVEINEAITYKDAETGKLSSGTAKYILTYDAAGRVCKAEYHTKGKLDHITEIIYDEDGNMLVYSNKGEAGNEYLRVEFSYALVNEDQVTLPELTPFSVYQNWDSLLEYVL